jgi:hypothetical protein
MAVTANSPKRVIEFIPQRYALRIGVKYAKIEPRHYFIAGELAPQ